MTDLGIGAAYVAESPSSIDRSSNSAYQDDGDRLEPGEELRFKNTTFITDSPTVYTFRVEDGEKVGPAEQIGPLTAHVRWTASDPGRYLIYTTPDRSGEKIAGYTVESGDGNVGEENVGESGDFTNTSTDDGLDLAEQPGFVNADNEAGARVAPALRDDVDLTVDDLISSPDSALERVESARSASTSSPSSTSRTSSPSSTSRTSSPSSTSRTSTLARLAPIVVAVAVVGWWLL